MLELCQFGMEVGVRIVSRLSAVLVLALLLYPAAASATPFTLNAILQGDPRPENPDDLRILVSILGDTTSNVTNWTVDLDMAATHPDARLDEFGFNLLGLASQYSFSGFNLPYTSVTGTLNGSGSTTFMMTLNDPSGWRQDATNSNSLSFQVINNAGSFSLNHFLLAPTSCSNNALIGCNQLGAHLQAVGDASAESGVAVGNYGPPPASVPEPGTLLLMFVGAGVAAVARRRQSV